MQIYLLDPRSLDPETIAVTFAKTSRSPESFREIASDLTTEKSARFHEKWVVGYGHSSVAEHAVLHIAVENVSRLAIETIESCRLASYTEKSTRYQVWDEDSYAIPPELKGSPLLEQYKKTCQVLFRSYRESTSKIRAFLEQKIDRQSVDDPAARMRKIHTMTCDVARYYLPASSLANVGVTINARALEHSLDKMLSHPLEEVRQVGREIKRMAIEQVPTLIKYASEVPNLKQSPALLAARAKNVITTHGRDWCQLIKYDQDGEDRILASALYHFGDMEFASALKAVQALSTGERRNLAKDLLSGLREHDIPLRDLEQMRFTFDLVLDQGAYFELKRHRMMTQIPQPLGTTLGFSLPRLIADAGLEEQFRSAMAGAADTYDLLENTYPGLGSYVVPNAFNRRLLLTTDLRNLYHLVRLRTAKNAHFAIQRVVGRMVAESIKALPVLGDLLFPSLPENWVQINDEYFVQEK